jgi:hypothetical protein
MVGEFTADIFAAINRGWGGWRELHFMNEAILKLY